MKHPALPYILLALLLAVLVVIVTARVGRTGNPKITATQANIASLQQALERFKGDVGRYPTTNEGLAALSGNPNDSLANWKGPYLQTLPEKDPWGTPYQYNQHEITGVPYTIVSWGPDTTPKTSDDIISKAR